MKMILLAIALVATAPASTVKLQESGQAKVGRAAPSFGGWDLSRKNVLTLDTLRRTPALAPLLITFGASWCKPCNEGLPRLRALTRKHPELRLVLIDVESDGAVAQEWAARLGIDGPAILDLFDEVAKTYGVVEGEKKMLPRTFLIDQLGKVRAIYREEGADLEQLIEADLEAATPPVRPAVEKK
jgi:peroxiredoxin